MPEEFYEAAEVDGASAWRRFWSITVPMVLPFLMLAVLFRAIENFKMFDMVVELTSGGPGSTTELASINLKREAFEKWCTGYTRLQAFFKVVLPQATTGIAATAIFCLIFAWNEYAFALLLTSGKAQTAPPFIPIIIGEGGLDWPAVAAGTTLFLLPVLVFTVMLRSHLLRGITFGAVRK